MQKIVLFSLLLFTIILNSFAEEFQLPPNFTRFETYGDEEVGKVMTEYLWYHLSKRLGNGVTLFNKEYLLSADTWVNDFIDPQRQKPIQEVHREDLLSIRIDDEGYIDTHQHFSHAYDAGWPFPLWTQTMGQEDKGIGWHFQPLDQVPGWVGDNLRHAKNDKNCGENAIKQWELQNVTSQGIVDNTWKLEATNEGPPIMTSIPNLHLTAEDIPFFQLRWKREIQPETHLLPYIEWKREGDKNFSPERRFYFYLQNTALCKPGWYHSHIPVYKHPQWNGTIDQIRICLSPEKCSGTFYVDSFFSLFDTRQTINNPIYILACRFYFNWTGDIDFLRQVINKMRMALLYQRKELGGDTYSCIVNPWVGHDGIPGFTITPDGKNFNVGHGIGSNYWDLLPFGGYDCYATNQYHASILAMAEIEKAILEHPEWSIPRGALAFAPDELLSHAQKVSEKARSLFWDTEKKRFFASIDRNGDKHDYGFTFLNLDAIWYGIASPEQSRDILSWLNGERIIDTDTSQGNDIYHWRFGPRATTLRNVDWYVFSWSGPEKIPWGGQVQDGGAVLGFTFYDLWARLHTLGPDSAWQRLKEIVEWEKEVRNAGGYRKYYEGGKQGTTLQGCNTAGGLGIDCEFFESSLLPSILVYGFAGITPKPDMLEIEPKLPENIKEMAIKNIKYKQTVLNLLITNDNITIEATNILPEFPIHCKYIQTNKSTEEKIKEVEKIITTAGAFTF